MIADAAFSRLQKAGRRLQEGLNSRSPEVASPPLFRKRAPIDPLQSCIISERVSGFTPALGALDAAERHRRRTCPTSDGGGFGREEARHGPMLVRQGAELVHQNSLNPPRAGVSCVGHAVWWSEKGEAAATSLSRGKFRSRKMQIARRRRTRNSVYMQVTTAKHEYYQSSSLSSYAAFRVNCARE